MSQVNEKYWTDLSGIIGLQKGLITDLSSNGLIAEGSPAVQTITDINTSLSGLSKNLKDANSSIRPTLTYQREVKTILDRENARLTNRKMAIDAAYDGQKRMINLTNSITAKNQAYNYMLFIVVLTLFGFLLIKMLYSVEVIPSLLLDILSVAVISIGVIYCFYLFIDIKRRSNMDFNQVSLAEPTNKTPDQIAKDQQSNVKSGNLLKINNVDNCQGSTCCPSDSTFNIKYNICVANGVPATVTTTNIGNFKYFANADKTYEWRDANATCKGITNYDSTILACKPVVSAFTTLSNVAEPFSATEFAEYSKY
jgi:hypothetical protein